MIFYDVWSSFSPKGKSKLSKDVGKTKTYISQVANGRQPDISLARNIVVCLDDKVKSEVDKKVKELFPYIQIPGEKVKANKNQLRLLD